MLDIADPQDRTRSSWKRGRTRYLTDLRVRKLMFMARQRHFPMRVLNALVFLLERKRAVRVHYLPPVMTVESVTGCNLRCPECPTGLSDPRGRKTGKAKLDDMKSIIDQMSRRSLQINFHHQGEPLLNDDFFAACEYAAGKGLWTAIHSNLSLKREDLAARIVASRLGNLVVSCDGATQEIYEKYRAGGDVDLVLENLRQVAQEKKRLNRRLPWLTAQFLVFEHNWHEMKSFRERAVAAGADEVLFLPGCRNGTTKSGHVGAEQVFRLSELTWQNRETPTMCCDVWDNVILTYDGGIFPCCFCYRDEDLFDRPQEPTTTRLLDRFNGPAYRRIRRFFLGKAERRADLPLPCRHCERTAAKEAAQNAAHAVKP